MNYQEVIEKIEHLPRLHEKNDLSYIRKILDKLGNPQNQVKTIHVTGTNGKGSTSYYLSNLLQKAGQKTGLFVSPYIVKFNERIQINDKGINDRDLIRGFERVSAAIEEIQKTDPDFNLVTFEFETALAFWLFAYKKCEYAVIEVGIGGEHDKTNVITPEVSIITTVGLDHERIIGPTIQDIAREKSGIIKYRRPVVLGNISDDVLEIILEKAKKQEAPVFKLGSEFEVSFNKEIIYQDKFAKYSFHIRPTVEGYDLAIAIKAFKLLGLSLKARELEGAINETQIPGRYQVLQQKPLIIADGAHNIQAMKNLINFARKNSNTHLHFLIGMMKDKDIEQVFDLFNSEDKITLTRIDYPRAAKKEDFPVGVVAHADYIENYKKAFDEVKSTMSDTDVLIITGSFYLVGAILNYLKEDKKDES